MDPTLSPVFAALLVGAIQAVDYLLTIVGELGRRSAGGDAFISYGGSYEANPVFAASVDRARWLSPRAVASVMVLALGFGAVTAFAQAAPEVAWIAPFALGSFVFHRIPVLAKHLQNIWTFRQRRLGRVTGSLQWERAVVLRQSAFLYGTHAAVLGLVAWLHPSPWFWGGVAGTTALTLYLLVLAMRAEASKARASTLGSSQG